MTNTLTAPRRVGYRDGSCSTVFLVQCPARVPAGVAFLAPGVSPGYHRVRMPSIAGSCLPLIYHGIYIGGPIRLPAFTVHCGCPTYTRRIYIAPGTGSPRPSGVPDYRHAKSFRLTQLASSLPRFRPFTTSALERRLQGNNFHHRSVAAVFRAVSDLDNATETKVEPKIRLQIRRARSPLLVGRSKRRERGSGA